MTLEYVQRCAGCGEPLPPTSAPAHVCRGTFGSARATAIWPTIWTEEQIRAIVRDEIARYMKGAAP